MLSQRKSTNPTTNPKLRNSVADGDTKHQISCTRSRSYKTPDWNVRHHFQSSETFQNLCHYFRSLGHKWDDEMDGEDAQGEYWPLKTREKDFFTWLVLSLSNLTLPSLFLLFPSQLNSSLPFHSSPITSLYLPLPSYLFPSLLNLPLPFPSQPTSSLPSNA